MSKSNEAMEFIAVRIQYKVKDYSTETAQNFNPPIHVIEKSYADELQRKLDVAVGALEKVKSVFFSETPIYDERYVIAPIVDKALAEIGRN